MDGRLLQKPEIRGKAISDGITHIWKARSESYGCNCRAGCDCRKFGANDIFGASKKSGTKKIQRIKKNTAHITNMEPTWPRLPH